ncbi:MAG: redoxin domain-containing protein [Phycisphaera sp.]|nr:redoxin domain-containing protein [Phycisphaera sp.]
MTRRIALLMTAVLLSLSSITLAGAKVGQAAPQFELKDVKTGQTHKLADFKGKVVVLFWHSTSCPWYRMRENGGYDRVLSPMATEYAGKDVVFLAINSNKTEDVDSIKSYITEHNTPYPILKDPGNKVADEYGARTTPHVFVIDKDDNQTVRYMGGLEKSPPTPEKCGQMDEQYLRPAIDAVLAGTEVAVKESPSKGCSIKRER